jgi:hypothetical protein
MPPEYVGNKIRSTKFDIFSLGVVLLEIMAGPTARTRIGDMPPKKFTGLVRKSMFLYLDQQPPL